MGLAMGLNLSIARAGSYSADMSPTGFADLYARGAAPPLWLAAGGMALALGLVLLSFLGERRVAPGLHTAAGGSDKLRWSDVRNFGREYWLIVGVCFAFYAAMFPFRSTFAVKYFGDVYHMSNEAASELNSYVFFAAIWATPLCGWLAGRLDRRSLLQAFGAVLLPATFVLLLANGAPGVGNVCLGIAFSLVPAVLWPLVIDLVPANRLGSAYGLMTMLQNIGLSAFNTLVGWLNQSNGASAQNPAGYQPMLWAFLATSSVGALLALQLAVVRRGR
jgi:MFS family permease